MHQPPTVHRTSLKISNRSRKMARAKTGKGEEVKKGNNKKFLDEP
jgi:hypothetical protein